MTFTSYSSLVIWDTSDHLVPCSTPYLAIPSPQVFA